MKRNAEPTALVSGLWGWRRVDLAKIYNKAQPQLEVYTQFHCSHYMNSVMLFLHNSHTHLFLVTCENILCIYGFTALVELVKNTL